MVWVLVMMEVRATHYYPIVVRMAPKNEGGKEKTRLGEDDGEQDILEQIEMLEALALENDGVNSASNKNKSTSSKENVDKQKEQHEFDEFYDEHADSEDERWVRDNLMSHAPKDGDDRYQLTCPSCFILLCVQCQPHERHTGQFRALQVRNCVVKEGDDANIRPQGQGLKKVVCKECETDIAVLEKDGTYIFCNVAY